MERPIVLNGFEVDHRLASLMRRADWQGKRTSKVWMSKFPSHPETRDTIPFVHLIAPDNAIGENESLRDPELEILCGIPDSDFPPGNFDPENGYLIGFTDYCDSAIIVDLRPKNGPRIIYDNLCPNTILYTTAFNTLDEFVDFYIEQHGR